MSTILLNKKYEKVIPIIMEKFGITNKMAAPRISKVTINVGIGKLLSQKGTDKEKITNSISEDLSRICGQKPQITYAKKDVANFKLRQGEPSGLKITLRGKRMADFVDRLVNINLPRTRDFKGIKISSIDEQGNLNIGIPEQIVFPEVSPDSIRLIFGFSITIGTTARSREEAAELLRLLGFPLEKNE